MDYDLFNFDPERHTGRNFSAGFPAEKLRLRQRTLYDESPVEISF